MEQLVRVCSTCEDGTAQVRLERLSACSGDCHHCSGCGAVTQTVMLNVQNPIGARAGDLVIIRSASGPVLMGAAVLYVVPILLFFLGYLAGELWLGQGGLWGAGGFFVGILFAVLYDRKVVKKRKNVYTITEFGGSSTFRKEEQNID